MAREISKNFWLDTLSGVYTFVHNVVNRPVVCEEDVCDLLELKSLGRAEAHLGSNSDAGVVGTKECCVRKWTTMASQGLV